MFQHTQTNEEFLMTEQTVVETAAVKTIIAGLSYESLAARLSAIKAAEAITKHELGLLSRELLSFIIETGDVRIVNTLLGRGEDGKLTLTVNNRKVAGLFFQHFLPFSVEADSDVVAFAKKKGKAWDKGVEAIEAFLSDEGNDLWVWAEANITFEQKPADYAGRIAKAVKKALADDDEGLTAAEVLSAVFEGGVSIADLMGAVEAITREQKEAA